MGELGKACVDCGAQMTREDQCHIERPWERLSQMQTKCSSCRRRKSQDPFAGGSFGGVTHDGQVIDDETRGYQHDR